MIRHAAIVALAVCLSPSWVSAQTTQFTVSVQSAAVRKAPSTASPVIGQAPRGMVLDVTRDIGAWVKVAWPEAQDGIGYVHQSMGSLSRKTTLEQRVAVAAETASTPEPIAPSTMTTPERVQAGPGAVPMSTRTRYVAPPTHFVGIGGRTSRTSHDDFGVSARVWSRKRIGVQIDAGRSALVSADAPGRVTSMEFAPSVIYSLRDRVSDNVWVRPYVGAGGAFNQAKLKLGTPEDAAAPADTTLGFRTFGGGELTFPAVARFAISADIGYLWSRELFPGFDPSGLQFSMSGHWYVK
ncbi:MAG TPA: SH3 domain-containing protein [Vicinamibacterales bacterium]|jgi:hypothetical protein